MLAQGKSSNKNLKDVVSDLDISIKDSFLSISYTKTNKLITALYMVTDIVDKTEPIRNKLRHLGAEIISDIHCVPSDACNKIAETVSFLNIASAMNLISEMNCNILKKEFLDLSQCIKECTHAKPSWLEEFLIHSPLPESSDLKSGAGGLNFSSPFRPRSEHPGRGELDSKGHTRIGVQKGSTLLKALSDKTQHLSDNRSVSEDRNQFYILKKKRRDDIVKIIKDNNGNATIKDVKEKIDIGMPDGVFYSEKTLQRELMSMTKEGILNKAGEKRWSRYFIKG